MKENGTCKKDFEVNTKRCWSKLRASQVGIKNWMAASWASIAQQGFALACVANAWVYIFLPSLYNLIDLNSYVYCIFPCHSHIFLFKNFFSSWKQVPDQRAYDVQHNSHLEYIIPRTYRKKSWKEYMSWNKKFIRKANFRWQIVSFAPTVLAPLSSSLPLWDHLDLTNDENPDENGTSTAEVHTFSHVVDVWFFYLVEVCNQLQLYQTHQQALQPCLTVPTKLPAINVNSFFLFLTFGIINTF